MDQEEYDSKKKELDLKIKMLNIENNMKYRNDELIAFITLFIMTIFIVLICLFVIGLP